MEKLEEKISFQGKSMGEVNEQLSRFEKGFPFLPIVRPAQVNDGILKLNEKELDEFSRLYCHSKEALKVAKFVPASGAASRMFKKLYEFLESNGYLFSYPIAEEFIQNIKKFPFYSDLDISLRKVGSFVDLALQEKDFKLIISHVLHPEGLDYGQLPKGLLKFHRYEDHERTPVHEHFIEGIKYGIGKEGIVRLHFTVSEEHLEGFILETGKVSEVLESKFKVKFEVTFSQQKSSTDTLAVDMDNQPFLDNDGSVLFRPGGHGALLDNLEEMDADLIFIKNIDNVGGAKSVEMTKKYKMAMGGLLLQTQSEIFDLIYRLKAGQEGIKKEVELFLKNKLGISFPETYDHLSELEKERFLTLKLERPIRVCGMVRNTGEPGGGPFWAKDKDGSVSLQIVEKAQINPLHQKALLTESTHFNPVDLVCSIKKPNGKNYQLADFSDPETGLISEKSKSGKSLKALELPGLWNGAMSDWNTLFVEVPLETFNPVKIINDLLREQHQNL
ncbi:DUF4301 family protein [Echinicola sp. CAU 1574]|uniref:DUF4301 family protein n=1 Tax=Echinicola arenosa TaxID=2774144 RepID=A0ABR9AQ24_9BACT|nr:DUF4301 family protein [Echinicola arenosa]MBD8490888.1 DUF4301 family protein [Echinicola arenosa]